MIFEYWSEAHYICRQLDRPIIVYEKFSKTRIYPSGLSVLLDKYNPDLSKLFSGKKEGDK